ncbi:hypothetical protein GCM10027043_36540 [Ferruginibacter profundus]
MITTDNNITAIGFKRNSSLQRNNKDQQLKRLLKINLGVGYGFELRVTAKLFAIIKTAALRLTRNTFVGNAPINLLLCLCGSNS